MRTPTTTTDEHGERDASTRTVRAWLYRWRVLLGAGVGGLLHLAAAIVSVWGHGSG